MNYEENAQKAMIEIFVLTIDSKMHLPNSTRKKKNKRTTAVRCGFESI